MFNRSSGPRNFGRGDRRRANHRQAMAGDAPVTELPAHPLITTAAPQWIETQADLQELLDHVKRVGSFAYDTEFIGESTYFPRLCLVQIGTAERVAVVDAMADVDLTGVWELIADPSVQTLVHAGAQDLEPVVRWIDKAPANVFDVQVAAGLAGLPFPLSLMRLAHQMLGAKLGKRLTFTSWDHRPLPAAHVSYAADDVRLLPAIHQALKQRLEVDGRLAWAQQECDALCEPSRYRFDAGAMAGKVRGAKGLGDVQMAGLVALVALRDEAARKHDMPARAMVKDEVLLDIVRKPVASVEKLDNFRGLPRPFQQEYGTRMLEVLSPLLRAPRGRADTGEDDETAEQQFQVDSVWSAVQSYCLARGVYPALATSRPEVADHLRAKQSGGPDESRLGSGWRGELIGQFIERLLAGDGGVNLRWDTGQLRSEA
jgi:ribonuclease D